MKRARTAGFTLMELLIVVIIVGILASVALPQFGRMTRRARVSEAQNMIAAMLTAEWLYYQENNSFTNVVARLMVDIPAESADENWDYAVNAEGPPVIIRGTGEAATPVAGIVVTGQMTADGVRTVTNN